MQILLFALQSEMPISADAAIECLKKKQFFTPFVAYSYLKFHINV